MAAPGQVLKEFGGKIDVKVEVDTPFLDSAQFGIYDTSTYGNDTYGSKDPEWTDITPNVHSVNTQAGRERWEQRFQSGVAQFVLDNTDGIWTPDTDQPTPWYLPWRPGRRIRIVALPDPTVDPLLPTSKVPLWTGEVDSATDQFNQAGYDLSTLVVASDFMARLSRINPPALVTPTGVQTTSQRVHAALDRANWPSDLRDIQAGLHTMQSSFLAQSVLEECQRAAESEGGAFYVTADGVATFRNREWLNPVSFGDQVNFFTGVSPAGLTWDGTQLWIGDTSSDQIRRVDPSTGDTLGSFTFAGTLATGLAWDGDFLWAVSRSTDEIIKLDPADGSFIESFSSPGSEPYGLTWDGMHLWNTDSTTNTVYKLDPSDGSVLFSFPAPGETPTPRGITFDGRYLWVASDNASFTGEVYRVDPSTGYVVDSFPVPDNFPRGITWDGTFLWLVDESNNIYRYRAPNRSTEIQGYLGYPEQVLPYDFADFSDGDITALDGWTKSGGQWNIASGVLTQLETGGHFYGPYILVHDDLIDAELFELLVKVDRSATAGVFGLCAFAGGGATNREGYWLRSSGSDVIFVEYNGAENASGGTTLGTLSGAIAGTDDIWMRLRYEGSGVFKIKAWTEGTTEPAWTEVVDTTWVTNGSDLHGMQTTGRSSTQTFLEFGATPGGAEIDIVPRINTAHILSVKPSWETARIRNDIQLSRVGGTVYQTEDTASIGLYDRRSYRRLDYQNNLQSEIQFLADRMLTAWKDNRYRIDSVTIAGNDDPDNEDLNRMLWDTRFGDLLSVLVSTQGGDGWSYEVIQTHVMGITHRLTADDWTVIFALDDSEAFQEEST